MKVRRNWRKPYIVLPAVLAVYAVVMAYMGRANYFDPEQRASYLISLAVEAVILVGLFFFLRKRHALRQRRKDDTKSTKE